MHLHYYCSSKTTTTMNASTNHRVHTTNSIHMTTSRTGQDCVNLLPCATLKDGWSKVGFPKGGCCNTSAKGLTPVRHQGELSNQAKKHSLCRAQIRLMPGVVNANDQIDHKTIIYVPQAQSDTKLKDPGPPLTQTAPYYTTQSCNYCKNSLGLLARV